MLFLDVRWHGGLLCCVLLSSTRRIPPLLFHTHHNSTTPALAQFLGTFYQCVKRELPYEAVHVYQKIKEASAGQGQPVDLSLCNSLLSVAVGECMRQRQGLI